MTRAVVTRKDTVMDEEEFDDLFAETDLLAKLPQNALTPRTSPRTQVREQEGEEVTIEDTSIDDFLYFKADSNADLPPHTIHSCISLPDSVLMPSALLPSNTDIGKENEHTFQSSSLRTLPGPARLANVGVISKIEAIMESLADGILEARGSLAIPLRTRASRPKLSTTSHAGTGVANDLHQPKDVCFPGSTPQEAWRFSTTPYL